LQGIFIHGGGRPKSKKQVKELISVHPEAVYVEATSVFGDEWQGRADHLPVGTKVQFVGPDPYTQRKFYGTLENTGTKLVVR
jgi:hypothetical protein